MNHQQKKITVSLTDYDCESDLMHRMIMGNLTKEQHEVIREITEHSLSIPVTSLAKTLGVSQSSLVSTLELLTHLKLFEIKGSTLVVNKEKRKYFESEIAKFEEGFDPDLNYAQSLMNKIPIHVLPNWYVLSRDCENIFESILEKCLNTPKLFWDHVETIQYPSPEAKAIVEALYQSDELKLDGEEIRNKLSLSLEQFHSKMLFLEYNMICCISYEYSGEQWKEKITPFREWREYLVAHRKMKPAYIEPVSEIERDYDDDFGFVLEFSQELSSKSLHSMNRVSLHLAQTLQLLDIDNGVFTCTETCRSWLERPIADRAMSLYKLDVFHSIPYSDIDLFEIERALRAFAKDGWIYLDDFLNCLSVPLGKKEAITLKQKGKKWGYAFPTYSEEDYAFVRSVICEKLFYAGFVALGRHNGRVCLTLTKFGSQTLG